MYYYHLSWRPTWTQEQLESSDGQRPKAHAILIWTRTRKVLPPWSRIYHHLVNSKPRPLSQRPGLRLLHNLVKLSSFFREAVTKDKFQDFLFYAASCHGVPNIQRRRHGRAKKSRENVAAQKSRPNMSGFREAVTKKSAKTFFLYTARCRGVPSRPEEAPWKSARAADSAGTSLQRLYYQQRGYSPR